MRAADLVGSNNQLNTLRKVRGAKRSTRRKGKQTATPHLSPPTYDKSAVMKAAHREWKYAVMKGWDKLDNVTFSSCLRIAHGVHQAYLRRAIYAAHGLRLVA